MRDSSVSRLLGPMAHTGDPDQMRSRRALIAALIAVAGMWLAYIAFNTQQHSDFGAVWFGAQELLHHRNPYALIGHGKTFDQWPLLYPAPALVAVIPFVTLSERIATTLFVGLSTFLLAFGATRRGWHLLPLFISEAYTSSARLGQWSILITAALFFPWISLIAIAKPQASVPILASTTDARSFKAAVLGGVLLLAISFVLYPGWPAPWMANVRAAQYMDAPITSVIGILIALVLIRWRRPEAWLVFAMACMPQSWGWYSTLALFTIPETFAESVVLAGAATIGGLLFTMTMPANATMPEFMDWLERLVLVTIYLPVTIMILRRPNEGLGVAWMRGLRRLPRRRAAVTQ